MTTDDSAGQVADIQLGVTSVREVVQVKRHGGGPLDTGWPSSILRLQGADHAVTDRGVE